MKPGINRLIKRSISGGQGKLYSTYNSDPPFSSLEVFFGRTAVLLLRLCVDHGLVLILGMDGGRHFN